MKYGRSLQELAIELDRQAKVKKRDHSSPQAGGGGTSARTHHHNPPSHPTTSGCGQRTPAC